MKEVFTHERKKKKIQAENRKLVKKYPFLKPTNSWTGLEIEDYNYNFTLLDDIPEGWKKRFGIALCKDLKEILEKNNCLEEFCILQIKEKFGSLRIYDNGAPKEWHEHLWAWEYISSHTCIKCGDFPVPLRNDGWICPECNSCPHGKNCKKI